MDDQHARASTRQREPAVLEFTAPPSPEPTRWRENLHQVLPLFFIAAACFVISYFLFQQTASIHPTRIPLWLLSSSIGVVATVGATTAVVLGDFSEPEPSPTERAWRSGEYVLVPRAVWASRDRRASTDPSAPATLIPTRHRSHTEPPRPVPAHARPSPAPPPVQPSADRLAAQVDQLLRELDLDSAPSPAGSTSASPPVAEWDEDEPVRARTGLEEGLAARMEYESLLRSLTSQAEESHRGTPSAGASLRCALCGEPVRIEDPWESCPACQRAYCPTCVPRVHPTGAAFRCPRCALASRR